MKAGFFGGAFNPPTTAHLAIIHAALAQLNLDLLLIIPSFKPPHKTIDPIWTFETRFLMTQIACASIEIDLLRNQLQSRWPLIHWCAFLEYYQKYRERNFDQRIIVSEVEKGLPIGGYTIDTLNYFISQHPDWSPVFIIGMDEAANFWKWKDWDKLSRMAEIFSAPRKGFHDDLILKQYPFMRLLKLPPLAVSSTTARKKLELHESVEAEVPEIIGFFLKQVAAL